MNVSPELSINELCDAAAVYTFELECLDSLIFSCHAQHHQTSYRCCKLIWMSSLTIDNLLNYCVTSLGFAAKRAWLDAIVQQLQAVHAGSFVGAMPNMRDQQLLLDQLLVADFRAAGAGGHLPSSMQVGQFAAVTVSLVVLFWGATSSSGLNERSVQ